MTVRSAVIAMSHSAKQIPERLNSLPSNLALTLKPAKMMHSSPGRAGAHMKTGYCRGLGLSLLQTISCMSSPADWLGYDLSCRHAFIHKSTG